MALDNLGNAYKNLGDTQRAIEFYERALAISQKLGNKRRSGQMLWNMAFALKELKDLPQAIACAEAALAIYDKIEHPQAEAARKILAEWKADEAADQT